MPAVHLLIKGKVQGVFYRASAKEKADELGLNGWVKNTTDGSVEAVASGPEPALNQFVAWCRQGPPRANVTEVKITETEEPDWKEFKVIR